MYEYVAVPISNGGTTEEGLIEPSISVERASRNLFRRTCLRRMRKRSFVIEDLTEVAGIDPHAASRASVKIRSLLRRSPVLSARNVVHGRQNPRANARFQLHECRQRRATRQKRRVANAPGSWTARQPPDFRRAHRVNPTRGSSPGHHQDNGYCTTS